MVEARRAWAELRPKLNPRRLVFLDGAVNGGAFLAHAEQFPTPTPGGVAALDNLSPRKVGGVREAVEALWQTIGKLLDRFSPTKRADRIRHSGFARSGLRKSRGEQWRFDPVQSITA